jgi:hypothetical protein
MATPKLPPVYAVTWVDASDAFPAWSDPGKVKADDVVQLVTSVGFLLTDVVPDHLTLATSAVPCDGDLHYGGGIHIPTSLVRSKRKL